MCGFIGKFSTTSIKDDTLLNPNKLIECRGPDSNIVLNGRDENFNYSLSFNRLAIVDLDTKANQPMISSQTGSILLFNGEIFNHQELRNSLIKKNDIKFLTSHSDTETVLHGIDAHSESFIKKLRGQFALTFIDKINKKIILSRDRVGQKPLYYYYDKKNLCFSSNLKSLLMTKGKYEIDSNMVHQYLNLGAIKAPNTIFKNIYKVEPAQTIIFDYSNGYLKKSSEIYWNLNSFIGKSKFNVDEFMEIFSNALRIRTYSDVPIATFLSGGLDSTSIVKNLYENNLRLDTFTVQMDSDKYDESIWSNEVASKYNTNHKQINLSSNIDFKNVTKIINFLDEPMADPSIVPTYLISNKMSENYKVAISGDGGDELMGGYYRTNHVLFGRRINMIKYLNKLYPPRLGTGNKFISHSSNNQESYASFIEDRNLLKVLGINKFENNEFGLTFFDTGDDYKNLLLNDYKYYLPEMMMYKVDRMSMANSLEVRSPFVDHKLIEYIFSHDTTYLSKGSSKSILRNYLINDFDYKFINRKKQGFTFNLESFVFKNIDFINEKIVAGSFTADLDPNFVNKLTSYKSRINANRIWKLFILESYLSSI